MSALRILLALTLAAAIGLTVAAYFGYGIVIVNPTGGFAI